MALDLAVQKRYFSAVVDDHNKIAYMQLFRISNLGENCSQTIDTIDSYTYPFLSVGLSGHLPAL